MPEFRDHSDFLNKSTTLRKAGSARTFFDPKNDDHVESLKTFVRTGNWGSASFFCEAPYTDVPMTVLMKFTEYTLSVQRETALETAMRMATAGIPKLVDVIEAAEQAALARIEEQAAVKG